MGGTRSIHGLWVSAPFGDARANRRASRETGRRVKLQSDGQAREVALATLAPFAALRWLVGAHL